MQQNLSAIKNIIQILRIINLWNFMNFMNSIDVDYLKNENATNGKKALYYFFLLKLS